MSKIYNYHYSAHISETSHLKAEGNVSDIAKNKKALFDSLRELLNEGYTNFTINVKNREV